MMHDRIVCQPNNTDFCFGIQGPQPDEPPGLQAGGPRRCDHDGLPHAAHDGLQAARRQTSVLWPLPQGKSMPLYV